MSSAGRLYFSDERGNELKMHPLDGCIFSRTGEPLIANGRKVFERRTEVFAAVRGASRRITLDDFPGHRFVGVYLWFPDKEHRQRFQLVAPE